ncbi:hypothetical protein Kpol_1073p16 [Vanderwaltozyma polyspora DSM 70294]|uniref:Iron transport multicopper oxidase FET3 n=1 Tax=Vanderwaltozyma polyspora (strain ATCC 22028 / DSM 70294 / BCRC 21397 / CBS 2163 / NBRC 10782 / NRRL Y-8283 / UCD 57-17) TaxID=436907 RepID=A7TPS9_VANPO|nr:uncharacterized protein Kpol_1073p16 [Vanderwaltozyma polyspora DSM 70294]EDO15730.1 hypothetical protein Kpol_1073p16 [Vanderwaltozyma polyspora DSM 70294]
MNLSILLTFTLLYNVVLAKIHTFNWTTGWGNYDVDGTFERPVITCNGEFPWPDIRVAKGDRIEIYLTNGFTDANTTLHAHGLFMKGMNQMDGPPMVSQCPIAPGDTFLYNFTVDDNVGTYWYHSHTLGQYGDGFKGKLIIEDGENNENFPYEYDEEVSIELSEWYHKTSEELIPSFMSLFNPTGAEPIPQNLIINNTKNLTWDVKPNTTYLLRLLNTGGFVSQYFWIEDHNMTVVEVDGVYTEKNTTDMLYITVAQRYSVLITTKDDTSKNYAIMQKFDDTMLDKIPKELELNATSFMTYNSSAPKPEESYVDSLDDYLDDFYLIPYDKVEVYGEPDYTITLDLKMDNLISGVNYAFFNNITYTSPKIPTLMTVLSAGTDANNPYIYGTNTNTFVLNRNETIDLVLNNLDSGKHPFHLHGHVFQLVWRDRPYDSDLGEEPHAYNETESHTFPQYPMMRDTVYVNPQSNFVLRFKSDNPGVWYFHCHIEWHMVQGLTIVLVEDPYGIQSDPTQQINQNGLDICKSVGVMTSGNAAGNDDFFNLKGQNVQENFIPGGFTAKGIVALTFSCLAGILGLATLAFYGLMDIPDAVEKVADDLSIPLTDIVDTSTHFT